jgi:hypothetical protein
LAVPVVSIAIARSAGCPSTAVLLKAGFVHVDAAGSSSGGNGGSKQNEASGDDAEDTGGSESEHDD